MQSRTHSPGQNTCISHCYWLSSWQQAREGKALSAYSQGVVLLSSLLALCFHLSFFHRGKSSHLLSHGLLLYSAPRDGWAGSFLAGCMGHDTLEHQFSVLSLAQHSRSETNLTHSRGHGRFCLLLPLHGALSVFVLIVLKALWRLLCSLSVMSGIWGLWERLSCTEHQLHHLSSTSFPLTQENALMWEWH